MYYDYAFVIFLKTIIAQLQEDDKEDRDYFVKQKLFQKIKAKKTKPQIKKNYSLKEFQIILRQMGQ